MRYWVIALAVLSTVPACADSRFRIAIMSRPELAPGKGQCDIRLEIDNEVEITVRRDMVLIHTLSGEDARDDGSDCNVALPGRDMAGFAVQTVDSRADIKVIERPAARNDFAVVLRIVDAAPGFGRYRFRLSWDTTPGGTAESLPNPRQNGADHPPTPDGFVWNNAITYRGHGTGESRVNERSQRLGDARVDIDISNKIVVSFTAPRPSRPVIFNGAVVAREGPLMRASMATEDGRLRGTMTLSVDDRHKVTSVTLNATDGQDHLHLTWEGR